MRRTTLLALLLTVLTVLTAPGLGAGYPYLNVGIDYFNQGRPADAITWFDKAIATGDLVPDQLRAAYYGRGMAQATRKEFPEAISSYTAALALKPGDGAISRNRAFAYMAVGEFEKAFPDLQAAHTKYPSNLFIDFQTGLVAWRLEHYQEARSIFARLTRREPTAWLWMQLANAMLGAPPASIEGEKFNTAEWPNPLKALYAGTIDGEAVLKAQKESTSADAKACDADFYVGEWQLVHGDPLAGRPLMQKAAEVCAWNTNEKGMALFEVNKMTAGR